MPTTCALVCDLTIQVALTIDWLSMARRGHSWVARLIVHLEKLRNKFLFSTAQCTVQNCQYCSTPDTCTACRAGYVLNSMNACVGESTLLLRRKYKRVRRRPDIFDGISRRHCRPMFRAKLSSLLESFCVFHVLGQLQLESRLLHS